MWNIETSKVKRRVTIYDWNIEVKVPLLTERKLEDKPFYNIDEHIIIDMGLYIEIKWGVYSW